MSRLDTKHNFFRIKFNSFENIFTVSAVSGLYSAVFVDVYCKLLYIRYLSRCVQNPGYAFKIGSGILEINARIHSVLPIVFWAWHGRLPETTFQTNWRFYSHESRTLILNSIYLLNDAFPEIRDSGPAEARKRARVVRPAKMQVDRMGPPPVPRV